MGTPKKNVYRSNPATIPMTVALRAYATAQNVAEWRTEEKREAALEQLRCWLEPMVQYLDKPVGDLLPSHEDRKSPGSKNRVMVLSRLPESNFSSWLGLDRKGNWLVIEHYHQDGKWKFIAMDGETLERMIWTWREGFLWNSLLGVQKQYEEQIMGKDPELESFTKHACFLEFMRTVVESVNKLLKQKEERLQTMRGNLDEIGRFSVALDPLCYHDHKNLPFPGYSVFFVSPGHASRCSADYLVKEPVEREVSKRNAENHQSEGGYVVDVSSSRPDTSASLLRRVRYVLEDSLKGQTYGHSARTPFDDKEVEALGVFVQKVCSFEKSA